MRLFYSLVFKRMIDLDHVQEISDLGYVCIPTMKNKDKDGIEYDSIPSGAAGFTVRMAFQSELVEYHISCNYPKVFHQEQSYKDGQGSITEMSNKMVTELELFKDAYEKFKQAWAAADGSEPAFHVVLT